ncbi:MAG: hypothetical protein AUK55_03450 [Syntrophobacteraceae bacterium CG2_30_61_12]|nr:MAG: hypothetical protein AUK55_03450 [Syntrophobacteraceae bacterium CG2_30_61_12]PIU31820.1 MAG: hypothetical protein COT06_06105 [Syntrophobacteraceae bacterium CG07_land_8_20_14_0_80_61_8]
MKLFESKSDRDLVRTWNAGLSGPVEVTVVTTQDPRSRSLAAFAEALRGLAGQVRVTRRELSDARPPAFQIGPGWLYHGLPRDRELAPFLKILAAQDPSAPPITQSVREFLRRIRRPASLEVYVTCECLHCPFVVSALAPLPFANPNLGVQLFDLGLFPELAEPKGIKAVPMLLFGEALRWSGPLRIQEVLEAVARGVEADPDAAQMVRMLKAGAADRLADMILERQRLFADFHELACHPQWSVRVGAVVVLETVAATDRELARRVLTPLWERRVGFDRTRLGDLFYLIGELGDAAWRQALADLLERTSDPELIEAGRDALARLDE